MSAPTASLGLAEAATPPAGRSRRIRWRTERSLLSRAVFLLLLLGATLLFVYPFVWMISASLKPQAQVFDNRIIPKSFAPENYVNVWNTGPVLHWLINSLYIGFLAAGLVTISSALVAFGFAYFRFPGRSFLFACVLGSMMLPSAVTLVPVYLVWNHVHLAQTQVPLFAQNIFGTPFYIFLQRQFFLGIPRELFEASRMDGDNFLTMFWRIAAPLAKPAMIVTFVFEFQASWTSLLQPLIYLHSESLYTLSLGLYSLLNLYGPSGGGEGQWQYIIAGMVVATVPMIIVFFVGQRYFVEGIATSGAKG